MHSLNEQMNLEKYESNEREKKNVPSDNGIFSHSLQLRKAARVCGTVQQQQQQDEGIRCVLKRLLLIGPE